MASKAGLPQALKSATVPIGTGVDVKTTEMLDGEASDMQFLDDSNSTTQYKTPAIPNFGDLGGKNNLSN